MIAAMIGIRQYLRRTVKGHASRSASASPEMNYRQNRMAFVTTNELPSESKIVNVGLET